MIVAALALTALVSLGGLTVLQVQGGVSGSSHERFQTIALYAAEAGVASAMDFLRRNIDPIKKWSNFVSPNNATPMPLVGLHGNLVPPGGTGSLFSGGPNPYRGWFEIDILNNRGDPNFSLPAPSDNDSDARVVIRSTGHGPNGAIVILEFEVLAAGLQSLGRPCPVYGQRGMAADNAGRNDCLNVIEATDVQTFRPGG